MNTPATFGAPAAAPAAAHPARFARRVLLAVTGLSPQVVTETLYALAHAPHLAVPTEVHLITTLQGAARARTALLHPDGGQFHALLKDYPALGTPRFDATEQHLHIIHTADGAPLDDIRTPDENAAAANAITALLARLTRDPECALHVSIAGGRKTMGFYLGYAFSLFARPQDRLSHVLVSEPFESHPEFFFPPATPRRLATRDGHHIDTADARVLLAEIPVVPLRHGLPQELLDGSASYGDAVQAVQTRLAPPRLHIDFAAQQASCGTLPLSLAPQEFAWLGWWALRARRGLPPLHWREADPADFLALYGVRVGEHSQAWENTCARLAHGMEKEFFQENNARLKRALRKQLGLAAPPYLLAAHGRRPHTRHALALKPEEIRLDNLPCDIPPTL